ncbi:MAG TPA: ABC transporter permease [Solirubrobacteraceae bacterium]|nr:ABC transporter permease [Solirubrobacteraceae bacterium]
MTALSGTIALTGLALRRDRLRLSAYVLGLAALLAGMLGMEAAQPHEALVEETELFAGTPAIRLFGLASGVSVGATLLIRGYLVLAVLAALTSALAVVRHTRQNEETGRAELVGAAVVGRHAGLAAALIVTVGANVVLAGALALAAIATGQPTAGSFATGAAVGAFGVVFAGVAAVAVQLSSTTRGAGGLAAAALGVAYVLSGVGNMLGTADASGVRLVSAWPAWLSPMGWGQQMRPFGGDDWRPLGLFAIAFVVLVGAASILETRRDVASGMFPARRGHAEAAPGLLSPLGLVARLQRGALLGWAAGMAAFGLIFGAIVDEIADASGATTEWYARMGGSEQIVDAYRASMIEMAGMAVAIYAVQVLLRMRAEEADGPLEPILATAVSRSRWMLSHVLNAWLGAFALLLVFALCMGLTAGSVLGDVPGQLRSLVVAGAVQLPGIMVIGGAVVAVTALVPRWAATVSWTVLVVSILLGPLFGAATLQLPGWMQDASPFTHIPKAPAADVAALPVVGLLATAAILAGAGLVAFRRRNLALPA